MLELEGDVNFSPDSSSLGDVYPVVEGSLQRLVDAKDTSPDVVVGEPILIVEVNGADEISIVDGEGESLVPNGSFSPIFVDLRLLGLNPHHHFAIRILLPKPVVVGVESCRNDVDEEFSLIVHL